jgi:glyoxylate reductase
MAHHAGPVPSFSALVSPGVPARALEVLRDAGVRAAVGPPDPEAGAAAWLTLLTDRVDAATLERARGLRLVANMAAGCDNVDLVAARRLGVAVTNTPGVLTEATADLAFALLLAAARNLIFGDRLVRAGGFTGWSPTLGVGLDLAGRTLGIVGAGRIGRAVARRARSFDMTVLERTRTRGPPLGELLERSDFLSLHVPLTPETHHLIGEAELRRMRPTAVLVNTARGALVDERALVRALRERWIHAAGLDVFEREPELAAGLAELPNVVLAPHLGSATRGTRDRMAELAAQSVVALARGSPLPNALVPLP